MGYDVELLNFPGLDGADRVEAARVFREGLEHRLGGAVGVVTHHAAYLRAMNNSDDQLSHCEAEAAAAFMVARRSGERAAFEKFDAPPTAHFAVVPHATN